MEEEEEEEGGDEDDVNVVVGLALSTDLPCESYELYALYASYESCGKECRVRARTITRRAPMKTTNRSTSIGSVLRLLQDLCFSRDLPLPRWRIKDRVNACVWVIYSRISC